MPQHRRLDGAAPPPRLLWGLDVKSLSQRQYGLDFRKGRQTLGAMRRADIAVVGGGIIGLAFAYAHAKRGRSIVLFERSEFAVGASVRNFGLIWPIGQRCGAAHERALQSRAIWLEVIEQAKLWSAPTGSMHLEYEEDEIAALEEFVRRDDKEHGRRLLSKMEVAGKSHAANPRGLLGALWSPTEINIDPRQAVRTLPRMLREQFHVNLQFSATVLSVDLPKLRASTGVWEVEEVVVCSGSDFEGLYPEAFQGSGITRCKLQMLRTRPQPQNWQLGPSLAAGLTLLHYDCFQDCASLEKLRVRMRNQRPFHIEQGIHVLVSQTALGELTIGDSHVHGHSLEPFDREDINAAILEYLHTFAQAPTLEIAERWNGTYAKVPGRTEFVATPAPGVTVVTGLGGAGMTMAFGLAEAIVGGAYPC